MLRDLALQKRLPRAALKQLVRCRAGGIGEPFALIHRARKRCVQRRQLLRELCEPRLLLLDALQNAAAAAFLLRQLRADAGDILLPVVDPGLQNGQLGLGLLLFLLGGVDGLVLFLQQQRLPVELQRQVLGRAVERAQLAVRLLQHERRGGVVLLRLFGRRRQLFQAVEPDGDLKALQFIPQDEILFGLFRLLAQRLDLQFQLRNFIADAQQIILCGRQPPLGLGLSVTALRNARRFFEYLAPVGAFEGQDLVNLALPDVGVALAAKAGVHQQLVNVAQARGFAVDVVFALAGAIIAPGDADLGRFDAQRAVLIVEHQRRLGKADRRALLRAAEDHVLHLDAPQRARALLAQHPADRVGDIGFAAAVRADDRGDVAAELQDGFVGERFEPLDLE